MFNYYIESRYKNENALFLVFKFKYNLIAKNEHFLGNTYIKSQFPISLLHFNIPWNRLPIIIPTVTVVNSIVVDVIHSFVVLVNISAIVGRPVAAIVAAIGTWAVAAVILSVDGNNTKRQHS